MSKTSTLLKDLAFGDVIYTKITIDPEDLADSVSTSTTTRLIKKGRAVPRMCVVLVPGDTSVLVTYLATFEESSTLPSSLDRTKWYPFLPASQGGGAYTPLPAVNNGVAQWASLRKKHTINVDPVQKIGFQVPNTSTTAILAAMEA